MAEAAAVPEIQKDFSHTQPLLLPVTNQPDEEICKTTLSGTFFRLTGIFFLTILFICSLVMFLSCLPPEVPIFHLNSLTVSNFTITETKLSGVWEADLTVENPNLASAISFERIESMVFYKENDVLAVTSVEGFDTNLSGRNELKMRFETTGYEGDQPVVEYPVLREMEEDRKSGMMRFSLRSSAWATYKTGNYWFMWRRRALLNPRCSDLNVGVEGESGSLIGGGQENCHVVELISPDS